MPGTPSTSRLVIRIKLPPREAPPAAPDRPPLNRGALLLILGPVAVLLIWAAISLFRSEPTPAPAATPSKPVPVVVDAPPPAPATETTEVKPIEPEVRRQPDASPLAVDEVIPDVSRSARQTIRGTIRVSIRVIVDQQGTVLAATADEPGPSRYFERLSVEAAKQWTFVPAASPEQRVMLVRFYFKRSGTTARAISAPR